MYVRTYVCVCIYMYVCMCVCIYVCMYACMHVCMYACTYVCTHACMYVLVRVYVYMYVRTYVHICMYICTYVRMYICMYVCMYGWMYACVYVSMYVCMYHIYVCTCLSVCPFIHSSLSLSIHPCLFVCISFYPTVRLLVCHSVILSVSVPGTDQCGPNSELLLLSSITKRPIALPILLLAMRQDFLLEQGFLTLLLFHGPL